LSIDELKKKLREEAEIKAREIVEEARVEAEKIIREAEEQWRNNYEEERKKYIVEAEMNANKILSEARIKAKLITSSAKAEVFNKIFREVEQIIVNRVNIDVRESMKRLLDEALTYIDKPMRVIVDPRDVDVIRELLRERNIDNVVIETSNDIIGGLILESIDGRKVDNSYKTRLSRARSVLGSLITRSLWSS